MLYYVYYIIKKCNVFGIYPEGPCCDTWGFL